MFTLKLQSVLHVQRKNRSGRNVFPSENLGKWIKSGSPASLIVYKGLSSVGSLLKFVWTSFATIISVHEKLSCRCPIYYLTFDLRYIYMQLATNISICLCNVESSRFIASRFADLAGLAHCGTHKNSLV